MFNFGKPRAYEATHSARMIAAGYSACVGLLRRIARDQRGATAITTALVSVVLIGFVGLGTEVGMWYSERRAMQTASDAAAMGGAFKIYKDSQNVTLSAVQSAAKKDSKLNGFEDLVENVTVTVNRPPMAGENVGDDDAVETIVTKKRATMLSSFFLGNEVDIKVRSVATVKVVNVYCVMALSPSDDAALFFGGTADVLLKNCGIIVNSDHADGAMTATGASVVGATYADVVGGIDQSNNASLDFGDVNTGVDPADDPYANLDVPTGSGCDYDGVQINSNQSMTLSPGRYCNGLKILGTAHLEAGEYVIVGGQFDVGGQAHVTNDPEGVTIFLTGSGTDYATVDIMGGADIKITATTEGQYMGMAFFQDRNAPVINSGSPNNFNGGSTMQITGAIYIPRQMLTFKGGNNTTGTCTRIVAYMISFTGESGLNTDCGFGWGTPTIYPPVLAE
ncbi:MAG TPA: TadE/TadG family type IV pilus assembly protein [Dongiaceae bacterium]|nr:TadE/TadG family type IV pilus assembly protein [Dongiaceae bacterium]